MRNCSVLIVFAVELVGGDVAKVSADIVPDGVTQPQSVIHNGFL